MARVLPGRVWEFYGSTEAQFTVCSPEEWLEHPGTVGRARAGRTLSIVPVDGDVDNDDNARPGEGGTRPGESGAHPAEPSSPAPSGATMPAFARFSYWRDEEATARPGGATPARSATSAASAPTATCT